MKICIIQKQLFPYIGVMAISGALKQKGHETDVLIASAENNLTAELDSLTPDIIGFSVLSSEHKWLKDTVSIIKKRFPDIPIIVGGIHAMLYPENVLEIEGVDFVCNGEGEIVLPMLLEKLEKGDKFPYGIAGIGYKEKEKPILQGVVPLVPDLNQYTEDRAIYYDRYSQLRDLALKQFMSSRGCPFRCAFCANTYLYNKFKQTGPYIRRKTPEHFVAETKRTIDTYGCTAVFFADDLFVSNTNWLKSFATLYKDQINIPYMCLARADVIHERHVEILAGSGCHTISIGVETGNEELRNTILQKKITNEHLFNCANLTKRAGIELQTSNMFCLPDETVKQGVSTIELNMKLGTKYMFSTIFLPFPKTALAEYCSERNYLKKNYSFEDMPDSFVKNSVLKLTDVDYLQNLQKVSHLCIRFPRIKTFLIYLACNYRFDRLFSFFYLLGTLIRYKEERKIPTFIETIRNLWLLRKGY